MNDVLIKGSLEPPDKHVSQLGGSNGLWPGMVFLGHYIFLSAGDAPCPVARDHTFPNAKKKKKKPVLLSSIAGRHANNPCPASSNHRLHTWS